MNKLDIMYKQIKATMDIMYMFLFKDLPITYLLITWWSGKKKIKYLLFASFEDGPVQESDFQLGWSVVWII